MNRRDFLKSCLAAGVGLGMARIPLLGTASAGEAGLPDIVAVRNGEPDKMFDAGIAAMGGMGRFVKPGQVVALKPNISWDVPVEMAANTHPALVNRVARHCLEAGAKEVLVFDNTIEYWQRCYESSGIRAASVDAGARIAPAEAERYYVKQDVGGTRLGSVLVHEAVLEADVLISLPGPQAPRRRRPYRRHQELHGRGLGPQLLPFSRPGPMHRRLSACP